MSKASKIVLRIQSADGTKRVEIPDTGTLRELYDTVLTTFGYADDGFALYKERNCTKELISSRSQMVKDADLKHGDMIYLRSVAGPSTSKQPPQPPERSSSVSSLASTSSATGGFSREPTPGTSAGATALLNGEDPVDIELYKQDGRIQRKRDEKL